MREAIDNNIMAEPLLPISTTSTTSVDDTASVNEFRSYLGWVNLDMPLLIFGIIVPCWYTYNADPSHPFQKVIELSLSLSAILSVLWLVKRSYLHMVLLMDNIVVDDTLVLPRRFVNDLNISLKRELPVYVLLIFVAKCALKIWWWHAHAASVDPFSWRYIMTSSLDLASWLYRTTVFFFVCIFIGHTHDVHDVRVSEFSKYFFKANSDSKRLLKDYLRIFKDTSSTNNYSSPFVTYSLSIFTALTVYVLYNRVELSKTLTSINLELSLCLLTVVLGVNIMLNSAIYLSATAKMIASDASSWHASQTFNSVDGGMLVEERKAIVNCFAANPCGVAISGMKVEQVWLSSIQWTVWLMTIALLWACVNAAN